MVMENDPTVEKIAIFLFHRYGNEFYTSWEETRNKDKFLQDAEIIVNKVREEDDWDE